jgi:hypothetical protein
MRTIWELDENKKDFDGFIDGNKKKLMRTIWELDENHVDRPCVHVHILSAQIKTFKTWAQPKGLHNHVKWVVFVV